MLLAIAAGNTFLDIGEQSSWGTISMVSAELASVAKQAFYDFGERPTWTERVTYGTSKSEFHCRTNRLTNSLQPPILPGLRHLAGDVRVLHCILHVLFDLCGKPN